MLSAKPHMRAQLVIVERGHPRPKESQIRSLHFIDERRNLRASRRSGHEMSRSFSAQRRGFSIRPFEIHGVEKGADQNSIFLIAHQQGERLSAGQFLPSDLTSWGLGRFATEMQ